MDSNISNKEEYTVMAIKKVIRLMAAKGIATQVDLVGVNERDIQSLEAHFNVALPETYRQYLRQFGRSAGFLLPWLAIYYDDLKEIREMYDLCIEQGIAFRLPAKAFIVGSFDSTFDFFVCNDSHDPAVYRVDFRQKSPKAEKYAPSFAKYLELLVKNSESDSIPSDFLADREDESFDDVISYQ